MSAANENLSPCSLPEGLAASPEDPCPGRSWTEDALEPTLSHPLACERPLAGETPAASQGQEKVQQAVAIRLAANRPASLPPRPRKARLLPQIEQLTLEGHPSRAIAKKLGVPRRTVDRWRLELRQQWTAKAAENSGDIFSVALARLEAAYREAMEAWRRWLADQQVTLETAATMTAQTRKARSAKKPSRGQAALLGKAIHAATGNLQVQRKTPQRPASSRRNPPPPHLPRPGRGTGQPPQADLPSNPRTAHQRRRQPHPGTTGRDTQQPAARRVPRPSRHALERLRPRRAVPLKADLVVGWALARLPQKNNAKAG